MLAKKRFGQNFLHDKGMIGKIVRTITPKASDTIVEIGPGRGAITAPLLASGCRLEAVEIDEDLIPALLTTYPQLILHQADALKFDFTGISAPFRLVGNLPYNISTPLLFHLLQFSDRIQDMHVMLQREVVERICALPNNKDYGRLSVMLQYYAEVDRCFLIPPGVFDPVPKVESALLRLMLKKDRPLHRQQEKKLEELVKYAFAQRRKKVRNNLKGIMTEHLWVTAGIDPGCRAENLTVNDFVHLVRVLWPSMQ